MKDDTQINGQTLALAAALAMLGVSVGVNVQEVLAAGPEAPIGSSQVKIGHEGIKGDAAQIKKDALQQKLPAVQHKEPVMPGPKPVDPMRR
jgi:hypothetical protein